MLLMASVHVPLFPVEYIRLNFVAASVPSRYAFTPRVAKLFGPGPFSEFWTKARATPHNSIFFYYLVDMCYDVLEKR